MKRLLPIVLSFAVLFAAAAPAAEFVRVGDDGQGFTLDGKPWHPFGCNYFDPHVGWAPKLWQKFNAEKVEEHFRIMESLGLNVVRVFLTAQTFIPNGESLEPEALEKFDTMLAIARKHGIRVHPTGPDHWEGTPAWRRTDWIADPEALAAQVAFWEAFAARYRDNPMIFAYDLLNEPHVRWDSPSMKALWPEWLEEKYGTVDALRNSWGDEAGELADFSGAPIPEDRADADSQRLLDYQLFRESLGDRWVKVQVDSIRAADPNHPVTVGLIQYSAPVLIGRPSRYAAFRPSRIAPMLDFLSVHFYPFYGGSPNESEEAMGKNLAYLEFVLRYVKAGASGKPLVVGEFGWNGGGRPESLTDELEKRQAKWCERAVYQGRGIVAGWLNWAYADTPSSTDLSRFSGLVTEEGRPKVWGRIFENLAEKPDAWATPRVDPPKVVVDFDVSRAVTDPDAANEMLDRYYETWRVDGGARLKVNW